MEKPTCAVCGAETTLQVAYRSEAAELMHLDEHRILELLTKAWNGWVDLDDKHPDDDDEFRRAIHAAQNLIAFRVARRVDPGIWRQPDR